MDELEYITKDALIMCDQGGAPDFFKPDFNNTVKIHGCLVATTVDALPLKNIPTFKLCKVTGGPCLPGTIPMTWQDTWQVKIKGKNSLIGKSSCKCPVGKGTISFMTSGQVPLPADAAEEVKDMQDQAQRELDDSGNGDSVGEAGLVEGMIPVWGSGRDLINDIQSGDGLGAVMNAGFLIWDVASIAAGVVSFGTATVAMQGAKVGLKATIKAGGKVIAESAMKTLGRAGFRNLSKETLQAGIKKLAANIKCFVVRACFTGDTMIQTPTGSIKIEDIKIGDKVFSYDEEKSEVTVRKVTSLFVDEVEEILEIETKNGTISTTRNHPFFVNGEFKDAEQINIGEFLFTHNETLLEVISLNYVPKTAKVYNFEVEENHCYFVGEDGVLVMNKCYHTTFFKDFPLLRGKVVIHHAVEQQVWKKWPGLFDDAFKHSVDNLRGIPKHLNNDLHLSKIRKEWNAFYKTFEKVTPSKQDVLDYASYIDKKYGQLFNPPL